MISYYFWSIINNGFIIDGSQLKNSIYLKYM